MSDKFTVSMTSEEFIQYIRRTPKKFEIELSDKLLKYIEAKIPQHEQANRDLGRLSENAEDKLRMEIATKILVRHAPAATINPESLADYCVEAADELLKRLKR